MLEKRENADLYSVVSYGDDGFMLISHDNTKTYPGDGTMFRSFEEAELYASAVGLALDKEHMTQMNVFAF